MKPKGKDENKIHKEKNWQEKLLLYTESCLLGIVIGGQLPQKYRKWILRCCAWFGMVLSGVFLFQRIGELVKKIRMKKQEEEGFVMRIVTEE